MSVLIKGMEMPKDDYVVMTLYPSGNCYLYYKGCGGIAKKAEVIEVPTPHGDLIDKIALLNHMTNVHKEWQEHPDQHKSIITIIDDELIVNSFPAIIKEEGVEE